MTANYLKVKQFWNIINKFQTNRKWFWNIGYKLTGGNSNITESKKEDSPCDFLVQKTILFHLIQAGISKLSSQSSMKITKLQNTLIQRYNGPKKNGWGKIAWHNPSLLLYCDQYNNKNAGSSSLDSATHHLFKLLTNYFSYCINAVHITAFDIWKA